MAISMVKQRHEPGPPMDLANMRRKALPRSAVPVILFILPMIVIGVAFYVARWLTAPV
jgi:hypothetical protein